MYHSQAKCVKRSGFTLVELLVVIGIIGLLVAVLLPMVMRSMRQAGKMRTQADFQTITLALEAYKQDFSDYPRLPIDPTTNIPVTNTGAATLGKALLGPYGDGFQPASVIADTLDPPAYQATVAYHPGDCVNYSGVLYVTLQENTGQTPSPPPNEFYAQFYALDGADGPGFRTRTPPAGTVPQGKVWGPYLTPGKIKNEGVFLLDSNGGPILYFPARPGQLNLSLAGSPYVNSPSVSPVTCLFNANDNLQAFRRTSPPFSEASPGGDTIVLQRIQIMFGDYDHDGAINKTPADPTETAVTLPFVLMAAGADGVFGPKNLGGPPADDFTNFAANQSAAQKCDDVTNIQ